MHFKLSLSGVPPVPPLLYPYQLSSMLYRKLMKYSARFPDVPVLSGYFDRRSNGHGLRKTAIYIIYG